METTTDVVMFGGEFKATAATMTLLMRHVESLVGLNTQYLCEGNNVIYDAVSDEQNPELLDCVERGHPHFPDGITGVDDIDGEDSVVPFEHNVDIDPTEAQPRASTPPGMSNMSDDLNPSDPDLVTKRILVPMIIPHSTTLDGTTDVVNDCRRHVLRQLYGFLLSHFKKPCVQKSLCNLTDLVSTASFAMMWARVAHDNGSPCPLVYIQGLKGTIVETLDGIVADSGMPQYTMLTVPSDRRIDFKDVLVLAAKEFVATCVPPHTYTIGNVTASSVPITLPFSNAMKAEMDKITNFDWSANTKPKVYLYDAAVSSIMAFF